METKELNLVEILKACPKGTELYSIVHGPVKLEKVFTDSDMYPIHVLPIELNTSVVCLTERGSEYEKTGECILFPSKEQRDWSKFVVPYTPKDGEFVCFGQCNYGIFKKAIEPGHAIAYVVLGSIQNGDFYFNTRVQYKPIEDIRPMYKSEKDTFEIMLKQEHNKRWNPEKKCFERLRWTPTKDNYYYYINPACSVMKTYNTCKFDELRILINNCFKTEEAAASCAEQIKKILENSKAE